MPVVREHLSISQFCELLAIPPERFNGVEVDKRIHQVTLVLEPEEPMAQTTGTIPQLAQGGKKIGGKKGKRGC